MIPKSVPAWQQAMRDAVTDPHELLALLELDSARIRLPVAALRHFPLRVPRSFVARMRKGDPCDPLLLQVMPQLYEDQEIAGYVADPVDDLASALTPGLLHKYPGRALLISTGACAVHCRYCFRREFPYPEQNARNNAWEPALQAINADPSIEEVILSGGDPLSLSDERLLALSQQLDAIPHLQRLRIHSRQPIVLPERVDDALLAWMSKGRLQRIVVLHCNHPRELDQAVIDAIRALRARGIALFNQSVLLRTVNDDLQTLRELSQQLFSAGVVPYYLHQLDRVRGAAHFEVTDQEALRLYQQLQDSLPGYMVPRLVREIPGELSKRPLMQV